MFLAVRVLFILVFVQSQVRYLLAGKSSTEHDSVFNMDWAIAIINGLRKVWSLSFLYPDVQTTNEARLGSCFTMKAIITSTFNTVISVPFIFPAVRRRELLEGAREGRPGKEGNGGKELARFNTTWQIARDDMVSIATRKNLRISSNQGTKFIVIIRQALISIR